MTTETSTRNDLREVVRNMRTSELIDVITNVYAAEDVVDPDRVHRGLLTTPADRASTAADYQRSDRAQKRLGELVRALRDAARDEIDRRIPRESD